MAFSFNRVRQILQGFDFKTLFIEELGWSQPSTNKSVLFINNGSEFTRKQVAELSGVVVFEISSQDGKIPDSKARAAVYKELSKIHHENLLIFLDVNRSQSLWYWVKREKNKNYPRDHFYFRGQPGDLFLSKLSTMVVDISEFDEAGHLPVTEVARRLKQALDIERVTKKFYKEFQEQHSAFLELISGIEDERQRHWYASVLLNRLMFIYFLQKKGFIDNNDQTYLQGKLQESKNRFGADQYYSKFLKTLFFEGFAKPEQERTPEARQILGNIKYLNGGLFLPHQIENNNSDIHIPDIAFENLFALFQSYSWNLNDTPGESDDEINPDVLGYIFEKYINQKAFGAYYTRPEITEYLCEHTIYKLILDKINTPGIPNVMEPCQYDSVADLLLDLDLPLCRKLLMDVLPGLSLLDPACGSGAFLVAAMKTLINLYSAIIGKIEFLNDRNLIGWLNEIKSEHSSIAYFIKKRIITENLFGIDIMEEATEITRLRLFLALVASAQSADDLEPLPNIDFNIMSGNSLIGLLHVDDAEYDSLDKQGDLFRKSYREILVEKNRLIEGYRHAAGFTTDLRSLRDNIQSKRNQALEALNEMLLRGFGKLGIKFEEVSWDTAKNKEGKSKKRPLTKKDIEALQPFHWGYEFDEILNRRGGFDAIITNPPWEIFKPQAKEFFAEHSRLVTKNKMTIKDFEKEQEKLMKNQEIRDAWVKYRNRFPYVSQYFRSSSQYKNQIAVVNGKKAGSDINLYKLFLEQCFNLIRPGGECGIVIPSGIYTDLGTKQLREMLFKETEVTGMFGFENRKAIFEGVDSRFKFVVLTFKRGGATETFPAAFMRHEVAELERFPKEGAIDISVDFIKRLSPDSLSVMEFKNEVDIKIAERMLQFPLLGEKIEEVWNLTLCNEFHMTNDSWLFKTEPGAGRLPLYEGKMIHQFTHVFDKPRYWIDEKNGRVALLGHTEDSKQIMDYQKYRLGYRSIASNTNERTMISVVLPTKVFFGHSINASYANIPYGDLLYVVAVLNSFVLDNSLRQRVSANLTMFYIYQLPVPRLTEKDPGFKPIVSRAARLICTTPEFDDLAKEVGLGSHKEGATDPVERARLRAELDGLVAHLYGLTEEEFAYILTTFPLVPDPVKVAALNAYRDVERGLIR